MALHSVFLRCAGIMAVTTVVVAGTMAYQSARLTEGLAKHGVIEQLDKASLSTAEALVKPIRFKSLPKVQETIDNSLALAGDLGRGGLVLDLEGNVLAESGVADDPDLSGELAALAAAALADAAVVSGESGLMRAEPIYAEPGGDVIGAMAMAFSADVQLAAVRSQNLEILMIAVGLFVVLSLLSTLLLRRTLGRPLNQMTGAIATVAKGDYDLELAMTARRDEFGSMAQNLQDLTTTLKANRDADAQRASQMEEQTRVVEELSQALDRLAEGVLAQEITQTFPSEYEALRNNFNRAVASLRTAILKVRQSATNITGSAEEISRASDDLSQRTETQAATLEQSAAALEELLNSVNAAAQNAGNADATVRNAREIATRNGEIMREAISAMGEIEKSSDQISEIITVIDDIAFQTNLLALNAGVEAARAGESGKGFAVVASEVRGLAQRSAEAAQQIKDLIIGSTEQVQSGVELVERAGNALQEMVTKVAEISDMVAEIAQGAGEQARGLDEINVGVANLDRVTQQNAAMVEEATAAAHMLKSDAGGLADQVAVFITDASGAPDMAPAPASAARSVRAG